LTFIAAFVRPKTYNGAIRELLKQFLLFMRVVIADITQQSISSLDHTFYLTIIETKFKTRVPKDKYDLLGFAKLMQMTNKDSLVNLGMHMESL
jgi:hypothetical protein